MKGFTPIVVVVAVLAAVPLVVHSNAALNFLVVALMISLAGQGLRPISAARKSSTVAISRQSSVRRNTTICLMLAPLFQLPAIDSACITVVGASSV